MDNTFNVELMILLCLLLICIMRNIITIIDFFITFQIKNVPLAIESFFNKGLVRISAASAESSPAYLASFCVKPPTLKAMKNSLKSGMKRVQKGIICWGGFISSFTGTIKK